jgi:hypothetical protein
MIYIITTCTRPENLPVIEKTIPPECTWVIVFDATVENPPIVDGAISIRSPYTGSAGMPNRNYALETLQFSDSDWIYVLDDDNVIHPAWYDAVSQFVDRDLSMIHWGQVWKNGSVRLRPIEKPMTTLIDTACYMVRGSLMKTLRYELHYEADGRMAESAFAVNGSLFLDTYLAYYNYLRSDK